MDTTPPEADLENLASLAKAGGKDALEELVKRIQDGIYRLALRMLFLPADAEDATQEILIKVITHLAQFKGESRFTTWVFRVASNHLLTTRKRRAEKWRYSFDMCGSAIEEALALPNPEHTETPEDRLIVEEVKLACLQGLLLCLSREVRLAFILGVVFEVDSGAGGYILDIAPGAFRQRLSRGRRQIQDFMLKKCSLINPENPCACGKLAPLEMKKNLLDPKNLRFANHRCFIRRNGGAVSRLAELDKLQRIAILFRSHPDYAAPETFLKSIKNLLESGRLEMAPVH